MINYEKLEYLQKWINHLRFMKIVKKSNINKVINMWENKINVNFKERLKKQCIINYKYIYIYEQ